MEEKIFERYAIMYGSKEYITVNYGRNDNLLIDCSESIEDAENYYTHQHAEMAIRAILKQCPGLIMPLKPVKIIKTIRICE